MRVSVICPVFNTEPVLLEQAVASVRKQTGEHVVEIIMIDDCSTRPDTCEMLSRLASRDENVKVLRSDKNAGPGHARTMGVQSAAHEWLAFIDSDDLWPVSKLEHVDEILRREPDLRWVCGRYVTLYSNEERHEAPLSQATSVVTSSSIVSHLYAPDLTKSLIYAMPPLGASLFRKELFEDAGGFDPRLMYGEDWLLYLRMSTISSMAYIETATYFLRRQRASMMWSLGRMSAKFARSGEVARRDPMLRSVRRELRWFMYKNYKDIAMNNALNNRTMRAIGFALKAWMVDPREIQDLILFAKLLCSKRSGLPARLRQYSTAEQVILSNVPSENNPR